MSASPLLDESKEPGLHRAPGDGPSRFNQRAEIGVVYKRDLTVAEELPVSAAHALGDPELLEVLSIPLLRYAWPDGDRLSALLEGVILRKQESNGARVPHAGGWHSTQDMQTWDEDCVRELNSRILQLVQEAVRRTVPSPTNDLLEGWRIEMWANVSRHGDFNKSHSHHGGQNVWSGVYYVNTGNADSCPPCTGRTKFEDRRGVAVARSADRDPFVHEVAITPQRNLMILFPATLRHYVEPYRGTGRRITVAFNLSHPGFALPEYEDAHENTWWWRNFRGVMRVREEILRHFGYRVSDRRGFWK
jgi:uncharacterized protein (TIGR02466 family)